LLWQLVTVTPDRRQIYSKQVPNRKKGQELLDIKATSGKERQLRGRRGCTWLHPSCNLLRRLAVYACTFVRPYYCPYKNQDIHCKTQVLALCPNSRGTLRFRVAPTRLRATQTSSPPTPSPNTHKFSSSAHLHNHNLSRSHPQPQVRIPPTSSLTICALHPYQQHVKLLDAPQRLLQRARSRHQPH
jgi:hypothetical protein